MTPAANPSAGELMRRLDDVVQRLDRLSTQLEEGYVRKDVQEAREAATAIQIKGLEDELHQMHKDVDGVGTDIDNLRADMATNRRWLISAFVAPVVVGIVMALLLTVIGVHK